MLTVPALGHFVSTARTAAPRRAQTVPPWAIISAGLTPILLTGGWLVAGTLQPASYDPIRDTVSVMAGHAGTDRWVMTGALLLVGGCHLVTAAGLGAIRAPARVLLILAGLSSIGIATSPEPVVGSTPQHLAWTSFGAVIITIWPAFTPRPGSPQPLIVSRHGSVVVTAVFLALLCWLVIETQGGSYLGMAERLTSSVQTSWPFVVAVVLWRRAARTGRPEPSQRATRHRDGGLLDGGSARPARFSMIAGLREQIAGAGFALGWGVLSNVPARITSRGFRAAADRATRREGPTVRQLRKNLRRVVGAGCTDAELDRSEVIARASRQTFGIEHLDAAVQAGRGFILALPHTGNYDVAGLWLIDRYHQPFTTVAERLRPAWLFDRFVAYRESIGMEVLALTGGDQTPTAVLTERLKTGGAVCLVADRDLSQHGVEVDFFGERARIPGGPALLSAMTGAALLPVGLWFTPDGGWGQRIMAPVGSSEGRLRDRVNGATQQLTDAFATMIAEHPTDWHMVQKLWLADLAPPKVPG